MQQEFNLFGATTTHLIQFHSQLLAKKKQDGKLSLHDEAIFKGINATLGTNLKVEEVLPEDDHLAKQLVNCDLVHTHGVESLERLKAFRLGGKDGNKTCYALINPENRQVLAAVFVYRYTKPVFTHGHIPGKVDYILDRECRQLDGRKPTCAVFFSISTTGVLKGAGERLIDAIFPHLEAQGLPQTTVCATLSPFRHFRKHHLDKDPSAISPEEKKILALSHLLRNEDPVQKFHLGNGASIADINLNANLPNSLDDRDGMNIMVNYLYSPKQERRLANKARYKAGDLPALLEMPLFMLGRGRIAGLDQPRISF